MQSAEQERQAAEAAARAEAEAAKLPDPVEIDLLMIGDILQHSGVYQSGEQSDGSYDFTHIFKPIAKELEGQDIKVVNQETILGGEDLEYSGYPTFNGPQEMGDAEAEVGFNVILRATNHAMDRGYDGLTSEISFWRKKHPDVAVIGAVDPKDKDTSVEDVYVYEKDGFRVALLNYAYDLNGFEDPKHAVSILDEDHIRSTIKTAHELADMVVVFPHWGDEYMLEPVDSQYEWAKIFLDAGVDLIIGGHPHVIEPVELLEDANGKVVPCFWSVGNFVSTQPDNENLIGGMAKATLRKESDGTCSVTAASFWPVVTHKSQGTDLTTYLLRDYTDELAETNAYIPNETYNTDLTVEWANDFCTEVLGKDFDTKKEVLEVDLDGKATKLASSKGSTSGTLEASTVWGTSSASSDSDDSTDSGTSDEKSNSDASGTSDTSGTSDDKGTSRTSSSSDGTGTSGASNKN